MVGEHELGLVDVELPRLAEAVEARLVVEEADVLGVELWQHSAPQLAHRRVLLVGELLLRLPRRHQLGRERAVVQRLRPLPITGGLGHSTNHTHKCLMKGQRLLERFE